MISTAPLQNLYISDVNTRKVDRDLDVEIMAERLLTHGLIHNLAVVEELGGFFAVDGGRRLLALQLLDRDGRWSDLLPPKDAIPINIVPAELAREVSLVANTDRVDMNPVDEIHAYRDIVADYEAQGIVDPAERIERCARHFGKDARFIEQRIRLAGLAPDILEAFARRDIGREAAQAYATVADQALQMEVFAAQEAVTERGYNRHSAAAIRSMLARKLYRVIDRWVIYAGIDRYVAAGGRVDRDLFMGSEADEVLLNTALVDQLVREKGEAEAAAIGQAKGFAGGALEPWAAASHTAPKAPAGFWHGYDRVPYLSEEDRRHALLICRIASDGSRLEPTNHAFLPVVEPAAGARAPGTVEGLGLIPQRETRAAETELQRLSRIRRERVESRAVRLALRSLPDAALARRLYFPEDYQRPIPPIQRDEGDGSIVVAVQLRIAPDEIDKYRIAAELEVDQEEGAPGRRDDADAAAFDAPPAEPEVDAHEAGDEEPVAAEPVTEAAE